MYRWITDPITDYPSTSGLNLHEATQYLLQHLNIVNLFKVGRLKQAPDAAFKSNEEFWESVRQTYGNWLKTIHLDGFVVTDWYPRTPGLYFTEDANYFRRKSHAHLLPDGSYTVVGKLHMIYGGYGSFRFSPVQIEDTSYWLCTATSDGKCHTGIPLAIPEHFITSEKVTWDYKHEITGKLTYLDSHLRPHFRHVEMLPLMYIKVEEIKKQRSSEKENIVITPTIFFSSDVDFGARGFSRNPDIENYVSYVSCKTGSNSELERARDWLDSYTHRYNGKVSTNYDEVFPAFANVPFSLQSIRAGTLNSDALTHVHIDKAIVQGVIEEIRSERTLMTNYIDNSNNSGQINVAIGKQITQTISHINAADNASDELKTELKNLSELIKQLAAQLPPKAAQEVTEDLGTFVNEVTKEKPRRAWWTISADGLKKAAENINDISKPVAETVARIISLINPFSI